MNTATIRRLNAINRDFYQQTAASFDETRGQPWPGWEKLLPAIQEAARHANPFSVLDVGCGNGRFGTFLAGHLMISGEGRRLVYHGIDNSAALLDKAAHRLAPAGIAVELENRDVVENPPDSGSYTLVVAFGVLHHIPGFQQRKTFLRALAERVAPGGLLAFACWRFYDYARFRARISAWPDDLAAQVERHDYLLDWRRGSPGAAHNISLRYCHYVDDDEHAELVAAAELTEILTYRADGASGDANRYSLLRNS